jgi:hypothetical protein
MIVLDDAGSGNLLGGLVIAAHQGERFVSRVIGPEWFDLDRVIEPVISSTVIEMISAFETPSSIRLCRSNLFNRAARDLARLGHAIERGSIEGPLQDYTEAAFYRHLIDLGLPEHILRIFPRTGADKTNCYRSLNEFCVSFVLAHPASRMAVMKRHCSTAREIAEMTEVERVYCERLKGRKRRCVECGRPTNGSAWRCAGAGRIFYVHKECAKWQ